MNVENFKNLNEQNFGLWLLSVLITNKQQIFWKRSSLIFITLLFLLKFSRAFEIILCFSANLWFITRSAFHNLIAITQLRNILIHFIRTVIFRNIFYVLTVMKKESYIIDNVIAISCNLTFLSLSIEIKYISLLETRKKIMQRILCSTKSTKISKLIKTINFYDDEYKFLNVRRWWITFSFLINSEYFSIFDFNEFVNVLSFILFEMSFFQLDIILYISNLLNISNLVLHFLDYTIYHIWFESRFYYDQRSEQNKSRAKVKILTETWKARDLCQLSRKIDLITQDRSEIDNRHKLIRSTAVDLEE